MLTAPTATITITGDRAGRLYNAKKWPITSLHNRLDSTLIFSWGGAESFVYKVTDPGLWCRESGVGGEKLQLQKKRRKHRHHSPRVQPFFTTSTAPTFWRQCIRLQQMDILAKDMRYRYSTGFSGLQGIPCWAMPFPDRHMLVLGLVLTGAYHRK